MPGVASDHSCFLQGPHVVAALDLWLKPGGAGSQPHVLTGHSPICLPPTPAGGDDPLPPRASGCGSSTMQGP